MGLSEEHKRKISESLKAYHRTCGKKPTKAQVKTRKKLDEERKKLKKMIEKKK